MNNRIDRRTELAAQSDDEPPPLLGTWARLYAVVVVYSVALILVLYWITRSLNR